MPAPVPPRPPSGCNGAGVFQSRQIKVCRRVCQYQVLLRHTAEPHLYWLYCRTLGAGGERLAVAFVVLVQVTLIALQYRARHLCRMMQTALCRPQDEAITMMRLHFEGGF